MENQERAELEASQQIEREIMSKDAYKQFLESRDIAKQRIDRINDYEQSK